ncbi:MAG: phosphatase PAP2 family protein [Prolixibacteraceae bacterium]|nr:phosphatase PAP2 family protein [Prolixibacteraceae bacterium]
MNEKSTYIPGRIFNFSFLFFAIISVFIVVFFERGEVELWANSWSNRLLDVFFLLITTLGSGWFAAGILVVFLFTDYRKALFVIATLLFVALFTNILKRVIFLQHYRPLWDFFYADLHRLIYMLPIRYMYSFPSGHTMTAFALATLISAFYRERWFSIAMFGLSLIVGISRVYLLQHYFIDVLCGAALGYLSCWLGIFVINKFFNEQILKFKNPSLLSSLKRLTLKQK